MSEIEIRFRMNMKSGKKDIVIDFHGDEDLMRHEHEKKHREIVQRLVGEGILSADEVGEVIVERAAPGRGGEIQLTDAIAASLEDERVLAYRFAGTRFDCGSHLGLVEATIRFALDNEALSAGARQAMESALHELGVAGA